MGKIVPGITAKYFHFNCSINAALFGMKWALSLPSRTGKERKVGVCVCVFVLFVFEIAMVSEKGRGRQSPVDERVAFNFFPLPVPDLSFLHISASIAGCGYILGCFEKKYKKKYEPASQQSKQLTSFSRQNSKHPLIARNSCWDIESLQDIFI